MSFYAEIGESYPVGTLGCIYDNDDNIIIIYQILGYSGKTTWKTSIQRRRESAAKSSPTIRNTIMEDMYLAKFDRFDGLNKPLLKESIIKQQIIAIFESETVNSFKNRFDYQLDIKTCFGKYLPPPYFGKDSIKYNEVQEFREKHINHLKALYSSRIIIPNIIPNV